VEGDASERVYALFSEGRDRLRAGDAAGAIELLETARDLEPGKGSIRETLALAYVRAGRLVDAEAELATAIELAPNDHYCYYLRGRAQEGLGFTELARGSYKLAVWLDPSSSVYRRALDRLGR
jgi:Flp pilus assembly protein TadD